MGIGSGTLVVGKVVLGAALILVGGTGDDEEREGGDAADASFGVDALVWVLFLQGAGWR